MITGPARGGTTDPREGGGDVVGEPIGTGGDGVRADRAGRRGVRISAAVLASVVSCAVAAQPSQAVRGGAVKCSSGRTVFRKGSIRAFVVQKTDSHHLSYQVVFACLSRPGGPHVRVLYYGDVGTATNVEMFRLTGEHLGFRVHVFGGTSFGDYLGWIDTRSGSVRTGLINEGPGEGSTGPQIPDGTLAYAIAADGAIAVIGTELPSQEVGLLVPLRRSFRALKSLAFESAGGLDEHFIQISATTVTWRTSQGTPVTVSR